MGMHVWVYKHIINHLRDHVNIKNDECAIEFFSENEVDIFIREIVTK